MRKTVSGLYAVTPGLADSALLTSKVEAALRGGAHVVQYRNKTADERLRREQALRIARLCRDAGACFIVNDSIELAREVAADGVHLGKEDEGVSAARALLGPAKLIGVSCYKPVVACARRGGAGRGLHRVRQFLSVADQARRGNGRVGLVARGKGVFRARSSRSVASRRTMLPD